MMVAPGLNPNPTTFNANGGEFGSSLTSVVPGDIAVIPGVGFNTGRLSAFDGPTVGAGFSAATLRYAPVARSSGGMLTVAVAALTRTVGRGVPLMVITAPGRKPVPVTVVVNPGFPAISGTGSVPSADKTGAGLPIVKFEGAERTLPPGPLL